MTRSTLSMEDSLCVEMEGIATRSSQLSAGVPITMAPTNSAASTSSSASFSLPACNANVMITEVVMSRRTDSKLTTQLNMYASSTPSLEACKGLSSCQNVLKKQLCQMKAMSRLTRESSVNPLLHRRCPVAAGHIDQRMHGWTLAAQRAHITKTQDVKQKMKMGISDRHSS
mmetsp:Transcript_6817/g.11998  ORF Transcript_6817/g.11998 Transcript_6817/m.11998 type:complete len:171 (-) Transcript_6817:227-739(-)